MHDLKRAIIKIHSTISKCTNMTLRLGWGGGKWGEEGEIGVGRGKVELGRGKWGWGGEGGRRGDSGVGEGGRRGESGVGVVREGVKGKVGAG